MWIGDEMERVNVHFYTVPVQISGINNRKVYVWPRLHDFLASFLENWQIFYCCSRLNEITKRSQGLAYYSTCTSNI